MESSRSGLRLLVLAVISNLFVIAFCFAMLGWNSLGAGSATRNTARFASVFFVIGFAAPGLRRWFPELSEADWLKAFVAGQMVHFGSVILLHVGFLKDIGASPIAQVAAAVLVGFSLVSAVGVLADSRGGLAGILRVIAVHLVFLIFALDYLKHPIRPLRLMAVVYLLALLVRYLPAKRQTMSAVG